MAPRNETRARAIGMMESGLSTSAIASRLGVSERTVIRWRGRLKRNESLSDKPRSGRPIKIHGVARQVISKAVGKRGQSTRKLAKRLTMKGYPVSRETVRRHMKSSLGLTSYRRTKRPLLTKKMKKARVAFAKDKVKWTFDDWKRVLWSDESFFQLYPTANSAGDKVWARNKDEVEAISTVKHSPKVMVWGMFSHRAVSDLHFVPPNTSVNKDYYREEILAKTAAKAMSRSEDMGPVNRRKMLDDTSSAIFMQDSAPPHVAVVNQKWLDSHFPSYWRKGEWPGNSPNLNPIENLWSIIKQKLLELPAASTIADLEKNIKRVWNNLDPDCLENLVKSMPDRVKKVIRLKGEYIGN